MSFVLYYLINPHLTKYLQIPCNDPSLGAESQVPKVLTAVDKFEVARRMRKSYAKSHQVRKHIASQQKKVTEWPCFTSPITRDSKIPWMNNGTPDYDDQLQGLDKQWNTKTWLSGKVPKLSVVSRFSDDLTGENLKRFMHEKIVMKEGEGSDKVIGVTNPQLVQYLRLQEELARAEKERTIESGREGGMSLDELG